jgi:hypothetical protein
MSKADERGDLVPRQTYDIQLRDFEVGLLGFLEARSLPTAGIFVPVEERAVVLGNIAPVLARISEEHKLRSIYISKFVAAVASGLFDAALNYLWDETISELRRRVSQYDLSYFYDHAVANQEKRKKLSDESDLDKIDDSELILGAREIELISDVGHKHLEYIKYMRNWASAAHPNQNDLTGLQLVSWLETCIREVISLPISNIASQIKRLLYNVKNNLIEDASAKEVGLFFINLTQEQANNLASGFFGIYTRQDTTSQTRQNIHRLLPYLWGRVDEPTRQQFGVRYGKFIANNDQQEAKLARDFLEVVNAQAYIPDNLRAAEIQIAVENLLNAHRNWHNFYNEPPFASQLQRLVGEHGRVPNEAARFYVHGLVEVFLTNGNGIAHNAEPYYKAMLAQLTPEQALLAVMSFTSNVIASRLQFSLCQRKYKELLEMMKTMVTAAAVRELIDDIQAFSGPLDRMRDDSRIKQKVTNLQRILG